MYIKENCSEKSSTSYEDAANFVPLDLEILNK